jgi:hypothetical protein
MIRKKLLRTRFIGLGVGWSKFTKRAVLTNCYPSINFQITGVYLVAMTQQHVQWVDALKNKTFRTHLITTLILLSACATVAPLLFRLIESREGFPITDPLLDLLPAVDLSLPIFALLYFLILTGIVCLVQYPNRLLHALQAYLIITLLRFITLLVIPLDPPQNILILADPIIENLFYQQPVTKDLFFSGHVGILALFAFLFKNNLYLKVLFIAGTLLVGSMILIQHAHYTVDVLVAPVFAWGAMHLAGKLRDNRLKKTDQKLAH